MTRLLESGHLIALSFYGALFVSKLSPIRNGNSKCLNVYMQVYTNSTYHSDVSPFSFINKIDLQLIRFDLFKRKPRICFIFLYQTINLNTYRLRGTKFSVIFLKKICKMSPLELNFFINKSFNKFLEKIKKR
jgi:hypothetical protein